jgi:exonuclease III
VGIKPNKGFTKDTMHVNDTRIVIHQNIRGLGSKSDELLCSIVSTNINPHLICLSEHHLSSQNLSFTNIENYVLGSSYARTSHHGGGVCIYGRSDLNFTAINVTQFCAEMNIEICAIKITTRNTNIIVLCIYRLPSGNFDHFVNTLDTALKSLYKSKIEIKLCGDFNVNFLEDGGRTLQLALLMQSYNIFHTVEFPTRTGNNTSTAIDNIFIDRVRINSFKVISISNRLSDHDAQCLVLQNNLNLERQTTNRIITTLVNKNSIAEFPYNLTNKTWEGIYELNYVNEIFNLFIQTYLLVYESSFPIKNVTMKHKNNGWITTGI